MGDEEPESESDDELNGEKPVYNPKKVPLDWTGKIIVKNKYKKRNLIISKKKPVYNPKKVPLDRTGKIIVKND